METFLSLIEPFLWLALALPAVTDDFFTNLILMLVAPVIVVVGGLLVVEYLGAGRAIKILLAAISFGFAILYGAGLFMAIYEPSDPTVSRCSGRRSPGYFLSAPFCYCAVPFVDCDYNT